MAVCIESHSVALRNIAMDQLMRTASYSSTSSGNSCTIVSTTCIRIGHVISANRLSGRSPPKLIDDSLLIVRVDDALLNLESLLVSTIQRHSGGQLSNIDIICRSIEFQGSTRCIRLISQHCIAVQLDWLRTNFKFTHTIQLDSIFNSGKFTRTQHTVSGVPVHALTIAADRNRTVSRFIGDRSNMNVATATATHIIGHHCSQNALNIRKNTGQTTGSIGRVILAAGDISNLV